MIIMIWGTPLGCRNRLRCVQEHHAADCARVGSATSDGGDGHEGATQEWQPQLNAVGSLRALRGVDVTTEIAGLVREIRFKSGDEVKAGAVLIQLNADSDLAQLASLQATADLAQTR